MLLADNLMHKQLATHKNTISMQTMLMGIIIVHSCDSPNEQPVAARGGSVAAWASPHLKEAREHVRELLVLRWPAHNVGVGCNGCLHLRVAELDDPVILENLDLQGQGHRAAGPLQYESGLGHDFGLGAGANGCGQ